MSPYHVYLLVCWQERADSKPGVWRFRLEKSAGGENHGFANLDALVGFLKAFFADGGDSQPAGK